MNDIPREKLRELLNKHGESLLQDHDRCEGLLKDHCAGYKREISVLVGAMEERIPAELKGSWQSSMTPEAMRARLVQRLEDHRGLAPDVADWAVGAWSHALGVNLGRKSDPVNQSLLSEPQGDVAILDGQGADAEKSKEFQKDGQGKPQGDSKEKSEIAAWPQKNKSKLGAAAAVVLIVAVIAWGRHHDPTPVPCANPAANAACNDPNGGGDGSNGQNGQNGKNGQGTQDGQNSQTGTAALGAGTSVRVRIAQRIDSDSAAVGQTIPATVAFPVVVNGQQVVPQGAQALVRVTRADKAGHFQGVPYLTISLVQVTLQGVSYDVTSTSYSVHGKSRGKDTAIKTGVGAGVGAVFGALIGKGKGAAIGAGAGAGTALGYQGLTQAQAAVIGAETTISFRLSGVSNR